MSTHKYVDRICCVAIVLCLLLTVLMMNAEALGIGAKAGVMGYEARLFSQEKVHTVDIVMDDPEGFFETCENEEYTVCSVVIDGEAFKNVAVRAKGNTSLSSVAAYGNDRYSLKIEFDHYDSTKSYYGLDKLCLNNVIQDNTYMKDYLVYTLMGQFGVASPLCSYVYVTVNGEAHGLYLAVEGLEEGFLTRNYGSNYGDLYKPDSMSMGGGRGNGRDFDMEDFMGSMSSSSAGGIRTLSAETQATGPSAGTVPDMGDMMGGFGIGSSGTKLQYVDDDPASYSVIFDSAKTAVTAADQERLIASLKSLSEGEDLDRVLDMEAVLRYFVVHNFVVNGDSYTGSIIHNYYLYEEDGALSMLPWDYNLAFGGMQGGSATGAINTPINSPVSGGTGEDRPMIAWIFSDERYTAMYEAYMSEFVATYLESGTVAALIEKTAAMIAPYVEQDPTKFCTYEAFELGVETIAEFFALRAESVRGQLSGTIGKTSATQDSATYVNADHIDLSAMGSMGGGMGGGFGGGRGDRENAGSRPSYGETVPETTPETEAETVPTSTGMRATSVTLLAAEAETEPSAPGGFGGSLPEGFEGQMPGGSLPGSSGSSASGDSGNNSSNGGSSSGMTRPDGNSFGGSFPGSSGTSGAAGGSSGNAVLFGVSVILLGVSLLIAFLFKGREM